MEGTRNVEMGGELRPGVVIGHRLEILRPLATGGMGELWVAHHRGLGEDVVLKTLRCGSPASAQSMCQEARALARTRHPNVVGVLDFDQTETGLCYVVLELIEGRDLEQVLRTEGALAPAVALSVLEQIGDALDHVHARGIVHCDLKPSNVVLSGDGRVKLVDFGLARRAEERRDDESWSVLGTPEYMAPEHALGGGALVGAASDRYAFAAMALELITGRRPYPKMSVGNLLLHILEHPPRMPSQLGWIGPDIDPLFDRAMARDPSCRFSTAGELVRELRRTIGACPPSAVLRRAEPAPTVRIARPAAVAA